MKPDNPAAWARLIFRPVWQLLAVSGADNDESLVRPGAYQEKIADSLTQQWMCIPNFGHEPVEWWSCRIFSLDVTCHSLPHQPGDFAVPGFLISGLRPLFCCLLFVLVAPLHVFEGFSLADRLRKPASIFLVRAWHSVDIARRGESCPGCAPPCFYGTPFIAGSLARSRAEPDLSDPRQR